VALGDAVGLPESGAERLTERDCGPLRDAEGKGGGERDTEALRERVPVAEGQRLPEAL
jgi:hypothetical protein